MSPSAATPAPGMHPDARRMLDAIIASGEPPLETLPVAEARAIADARVIRTNFPPDPVEHVRDELIDGPGGKLRLRLYRPHSDRVLPVLIYIHGGGWTVGNLDTHDPQCRRLALRAECLVVSVDYRLAPEHRFPAAVDDCLAAGQWVAREIARHGGDPVRVAIAGDSSGGTLSAVVSQHAAAIPGLRIRLQVLIYPGTDLRANSETYRTLGNGNFLTAAKMAWFIGNYLADPADALDPRASPLLAEPLPEEPPALILTAGLDPLLAEGRAYAERLRSAGVPVEIVNYEGWPHGFFFWSDTDAARDAMARIVNALRRAFARDVRRRDRRLRAGRRHARQPARTLRRVRLRPRARAIGISPPARRPFRRRGHARLPDHRSRRRHRAGSHDQPRHALREPAWRPADRLAAPAGGRAAWLAPELALRSAHAGDAPAAWRCTLSQRAGAARRGSGTDRGDAGRRGAAHRKRRDPRPLGSGLRRRPVLVRRVAGTTLEDLGEHERWLVIDLELREPVASLDDFTVQLCDPARPMTLARMVGMRRRWEIMLVPGDDPERIAAPESVWSLLRPWTGPDRGRIARAVVYTFHAMLAHGWRRGPLLLCGDSAHQSPPFLGQGMCAGIRDAANLAWKLAMVVRGAAPDDLLDSYERERAPHVRAYIETAVRLGRLVQITDPEEARRRDALLCANPEMMRSIRPDLGPGLHGECRNGGVLSRQPRLADGRRMDDAIGYRFAVLGQSRVLDAVSAETRATWSALDARVLPAVGTDWLDGLGARAAIVRPDRYLLGTADDAEELAAVTRRLPVCLAARTLA